MIRASIFNDKQQQFLWKYCFNAETKGIIINGKFVKVYDKNYLYKEVYDSVPAGKKGKEYKQQILKIIENYTDEFNS